MQLNNCITAHALDVMMMRTKRSGKFIAFLPAGMDDLDDIDGYEELEASVDAASIDAGTLRSDLFDTEGFVCLLEYLKHFLSSCGDAQIVVTQNSC